MTADGEDDEKIRPQGLEPYTFQSIQYDNMTTPTNKNLLRT